MIFALGAIASLFTHKFKGDLESEQKTEIIDIDYPSTTVTEIMVFPWRGVKGIKLQEAKVTKTGLEFDRLWFWLKRTDDDSIAQKPGKLWQGISKAKQLGQISCKFEDGYLVFSHPDKPNDIKVQLEFNPEGKEMIEFLNYDKINIKWFSEGPEAEEWFSDICGKPLVLVRSDTKPPIAVHDVVKDFADEYVKKYVLLYNIFRYTMNAGHLDGTLHFVTEKSVADLRQKVKDPNIPVTTFQFKPNIVLAGTVAFEEDKMKEMVIEDPTSESSVKFTITKRCVRCKNTAYNYKEGKFDDYMEPFTTLRKYRCLENGGVPFGMYISPDSEGTIKVGDKVTYTKALA